MLSSDDVSVVRDTERAILKVLAGASPAHAALTEGVDPADLPEAIEIYRAAGRRALEHQAAPDWWQVYIQFTDWHTAERAAAEHLAPLLDHAERDGLIAGWWFMRKHPCWRVRLQPGPTGDGMTSTLGAALDVLTAEGRIAAWWPGIYEAETAAFGGTTGIDAAHDLFRADSHAITTLLHSGDIGLGRRELSLLLCTTMLRAAGVEWYEQGDVWRRVTRERPLADDVPAAKLTAMAGELTQLMRADLTPDGPLLGAQGPLTAAADWADAFRQAGHALGAAARAGTLQRGLREILCYLVIFHWNRLGLTARTQSILAGAAHTAILPRPVTTARITHRPHPDNAHQAELVGVGTAGSDAERAVARFPLTLRRRARCADLATRVRRVRQGARSCHEPTNPEDRIDLACTTWNLAALIAADCAMPDYAAELCRRQFAILQTGWPVSGRTAIAALQPLVNLARLTRRAGDPDSAFAAFTSIERAARHGGRATIHGQTISFDGFVADDRDRSTMSPWLRQVLREDGTRALAAAGRWQDAAIHAARFDEAYEKLREARQTLVIARVLSGHTESALTALDGAVLTQPWGHAVAACLRTYARHAGRDPFLDDLAAMDRLVRAAREPWEQATTLFGIRLGLAAADLTAAAGDASPEFLFANLITQAVRSEDAFAARDVLEHQTCRALMTQHQESALTALTEHAGLGSGSIPASLREDLEAAVHTAGAVLAHTLAAARDARQRE